MQSTIITRGIDASGGIRDYIMERMEAALIHAKDSIQYITVRLSDQNGPKGGVDKRCQVHLKPKGLPTVVVSDVSASVSDAVDRALQRAEKAVKRVLERANAVQPINVPVLRRIAI